MKKLLLVAALVLVTTRPVYAVTVLFGATFDQAPNIAFGDYGLGINAGDHFIGRFSYDANVAALPGGCCFTSYPAIDFSVKIRPLELIALNSIITISQPNLRLDTFSIVGALNVGTIPPSCPSFICSTDHLWMGLALQSPAFLGPLPNDDLPTRLF
jgi:hypothetical protein